MKLIKKQGAKGYFEYEYILSELPYIENPPTEHPHIENPHMDDPYMENRIQLSTKELSTKEEKKKEKHMAETSAERVKSNSSAEKEIEQWFNTVWSYYPRKEGKGSVSPTKKKELYKLGEEFIRAMERYKAKLKSENTETRYIKQGSTFFNSGYIDYLDANCTETTEVNTAKKNNDRYSDPNYVRPF